MHVKNTFISISTNRQYLGYAIFDAGKLTFYSIASLRRYHSQKTMYLAVDKLLDRLFQRFITRQIAIKDLNVVQKRSELLVGIVNHIEDFCIQKNIVLTKYYGQFVNQQLSLESQHPTNDRTILHLIEKYPELKFYSDQQQIWQRRYYAHLFQAIAVGVTHLIQIQNYDNNRK